jgi:hypothetical protein
MRLTSLLKMAMGTGAALLVVTVAPATTASAAPPTFVPCSSGAAGLIAAIWRSTRLSLSPWSSEERRRTNRMFRPGLHC